MTPCNCLQLETCDGGTNDLMWRDHETLTQHRIRITEYTIKNMFNDTRNLASFRVTCYVMWPNVRQAQPDSGPPRYYPWAH